MAEVKNNEVFPPSNSNKVKEPAQSITSDERERREKVVSGKVIQKKKSLLSKAAESIKGEDAQTVGEYLVMDVVVPSLKRTISDVVGQGIDRLLFGTSRPPSTTGREYTAYGSRPATRASYVNEARPGAVPRRDISRRARATHDFDEIVLESRVEAEAVVEQLSNFMDQYEVVSVSDLYDLVGVTSNYMDRKWGWNNLAEMSVRRVREGYLIEMPPTIELR